MVRSVKEIVHGFICAFQRTRHAVRAYVTTVALQFAT